jgi:O-antigen/teichoic acid export membrane protein
MDSTRIKRLVREAAWVFGGQFFAVLGSLALVRVLTEYLEPAQYGELALGLTFAVLVNQAVMGGLAGGIGRYYSIAVENMDVGGYLYAARRLMGYATIVVLVLGVVTLTLLAWLGQLRWAGLLVATMVFSLLAGCSAALGAIQSAARQRAMVAIYGGLDAWLRILLVFAAITFIGSTGAAVMFGYAVAAFFATGVQYYFLKRSLPQMGRGVQGQDAWIRRIWVFAWPISVFGVFTWMQQISDRWALQAYASTQEIGLYAVVFQLGYTPIALITGMVMSFLGPILYQRAGAATDHVRNKAVHRLVWFVAMGGLILTVLAFVLTLLLHGWVFRLLASESYRKVSYLLPWVVLAGGIFAVGQMLALKLLSEMRPASMSRAKIVTALIGIGLNIYGAWKYGLPGIVGALVTFSGIYFLWMVLLARRTP